ncbi:MAG: EamA family transporter [Chitinophagales bacterium]
MFKVFEVYRIDNFQAIVFNYLTCFAVGLLTVESNILGSSFWQQPWFPFAVMLGFVFISTFQLIALTTQQNGVTVATIANKTTMVIPMTVAFFMYGDVVTLPKIVGILLAIAAIFLTAHKDKQEFSLEGIIPSNDANTLKSKARNNYAYVLLPLSVFLAGGFIETVINYVQVHYLQENSANAFSMFIFTTAAAIGLFFIVIQRFTQQKKLVGRNILGGIVLGIPNYGSIYFLIMALHSTGMESSRVFPLNNIGIVLLASLTAFVLFREKLTKMNILGVVCAVVAILLIAF